MKSEPLLTVENLEIQFGAAEHAAAVVRNVDFQLFRGRTLGIVGESGSGKSISSLALMGLLPKGGKTSRGTAEFHCSTGQSIDLLHCTPEQHRQLRGRHIGMVFQEPMTSLNPLHPCGAQVSEVLRLHEKLGAKEAKARTIQLFEEVKLPRPKAMYANYPHELSGGQKQRVMIAMAVACSPDLLIADEPTTALDVTVQRNILALLRELQERTGMGMIFITHDLGVVAQVAHEVMVMYKGEVVESGATQALFHKPQNTYTKALIACRPRLGYKPERLPTVADFSASAPTPVSTHSPGTAGIAGPGYEEKKNIQEILIDAHDVGVWYPTAKNFWGRPTAYLKAVDGVSLRIYRGETLGLVGESGCGKSTLGRALLRLLPLHTGRINYSGEQIESLDNQSMLPYRKKMQLIFQDPYGALNPRMNVMQTLLEPMVVHHLGGSKKDRQQRIMTLLDRVGLPVNAASKYPHEFSGGQRQRICIARALVVEPEFIVCDESVSALDVSVQAQVLNLLNELKEDFGLTYLFISHDLSVVQYMSDHIAVMKAGKIEEYADAGSLYNQPGTAYTRQLIEAIPQV